MCRKTFLACLLTSLPLWIAGNADAAIVTSTMSASLEARLKNKTDVASSTALTDAISGIESKGNSYTETSLSYSFGTGSGLLTGNSLITAEKTADAKKGEDHYGRSSMVFDFGVDEDTSFSLLGNWGFFNNNIADTPDSLNYVLTGPVGTIVSSSTTTDTGIAADSFSESGLLTAGNYQLSFQAELSERHDETAVSSAGWTISSFQLTTVTSVPEPSSLVFLGLLSVVLVSGSRRRRLIAQ